MIFFLTEKLWLLPFYKQYNASTWKSVKLRCVKDVVWDFPLIGFSGFHSTRLFWERVVESLSESLKPGKDPDRRDSGEIYYGVKRTYIAIFF